MEALDDAAALKDQCVHPIEGGPYVRSFKAGKDNSEEGLQVYPIPALNYVSFSCSLHIPYPNYPYSFSLPKVSLINLR